MTIQFNITKPNTIPKTSVLVLTMSQSKRSNYKSSVKTDSNLSDRLKKLEQLGIIQKNCSSYEYIDTQTQQGCIVLGLGKSPGLKEIRTAFGDLIRKLKSQSIKSVFIDMSTVTALVSEDESSIIRAICQATTMGLYDMSHQKSDPKKATSYECKFTFIASSNKNRALLKTSLQQGQIMGQSVNIARDLANLPANICTPSYFVDYAKTLFKSNKHISIDVIDQKKAEKLGMNAFLGVAKGSIEAPYLLCIRYKKSKSFTAWVGKGVTFDTGGISIKPSGKMSEMKGDMGGAAAVIGGIWGAAELEVDESILALIPLVENMPSDRAQKPGDVVVAMNGKSIEIINTDAEGRLILADALCYAVDKGASKIVDLATLTGACCVALGDQAIGLMSNKSSFAKQIKDSGEQFGERHWQLPLYEEYFEYLKSDVADFLNCAENRLAGTSTAGKFLEQFVDKTPWVHLDIASKMADKSTRGDAVKGMAGAGVRTLIGSVL